MTTPPPFLPLAIFGVAMFVTLLRIAELKLKNIDALLVHGGSDARGLLEKMFGLSVAAAGLFVFLYALYPSLSPALGLISVLDKPAIAWCGAAVASAGTLAIAVAQFSMGNSWRIGVEERERNRLVTDGIYRWSRNPIYVGMVAALAGVFLMVPDAITLALLTTACASIAVQVRIEEAFLREMHGAAFDAYCARTRRWM